MSASFPVSDNPRFAIIATTNGQTSLTIPFPFQLASDIRVVKTATSGVQSELQRPANFNVTGAGEPEGGTVTLAAAARTGEQYLVLGNTIPTRLEDVTRGGKFKSAAIDVDLDRLTLMVQELRRDVVQAFRAAYGSTPGLVTVGTEGTVPVWGPDGDLLEGPSAAAIDAIETALAVEAGRALIHGAGGSDPYEAGGRRVAGLADATEPDEAVTLAQLEALEGEIDPAGLTERVEILETAIRTGDVKFNFDDTAETGWLFAEGGYIGSASSSASVRANADTEPLFTYLWARRVKLGITIRTSAGAPTTFGANAAADFAANRQLELPDLSKRFPRAAGSGLDVGTKQDNQNKAHNHTASTGTAGSHAHSNTRPIRSGANDNSAGRANPGGDAGDQSHGTYSWDTASAGDHAHSVTVNSSGGDEARPDSFVLRALIRL